MKIGKTEKPRVHALPKGLRRGLWIGGVLLVVVLLTAGSLLGMGARNNRDAGGDSRSDAAYLAERINAYDAGDFPAEDPDALFERLGGESGLHMTQERFLNALAEIDIVLGEDGRPAARVAEDSR